MNEVMRKIKNTSRTEDNKKENNNVEVENFCTNRDLRSFFDSFNSSSSSKNYQCFNCKVWKLGRKLIAIGQFDELTREVFGFRFCRACWQSYQNVGQEMKKEFIDRIRNKIKKISGVKTDA